MTVWFVLQLQEEGEGEGEDSTAHEVGIDVPSESQTGQDLSQTGQQLSQTGQQLSQTGQNQLDLDQLGSGLSPQMGQASLGSGASYQDLEASQSSVDEVGVAWGGSRGNFIN